MATNLYPRGTTQWRRRSVHFAAVLDDPIIIRMWNRLAPGDVVFHRPAEWQKFGSIRGRRAA